MTFSYMTSWDETALDEYISCSLRI